MTRAAHFPARLALLACACLLLPGSSGGADWRLGVRPLEGELSEVERLALRLTGRTFWGHGGIGSEPRAALIDVPLVDRLALEMAAHEDTERRALDGELAELEAAWRDAEEIAAIADALFPVPAPVPALGGA